MPTAGSHVDDDLFEEIKAAAERAGHKNMSSFVKEAIMEKMSLQDRATLPTVRSSDCMVKLAEIFVPTWVEEVKERTRGVDQPKALEIILKLYASEELGLRDVWMREQYPLAAAEEVAKYGRKDPPAKE